MIDEENQQAAANSEQKPMDFGIQRIYVKDISYEAPLVPKIFTEIFQKGWSPQVEIDLQNKSYSLEEDVYEVVLTITTTVKTHDEMAFLVEVQQAGIFIIRNFPEDQMNHLLGSFCPGIIYPYAIESITNLVTRGGFPQLYLSPINFDAIYQQKLAQNEGQETEH